MVLDDDQYATDLGKCIKSLIEVEKQTNEQVCQDVLKSFLPLAV